MKDQIFCQFLRLNLLIPHVNNLDAPSHSLKDSNANPKVKTMEEGVGVRFLTRSILL
jgi:hypothetical protein